MTTKKLKPVVIVGAGVSGLSLACMLAHQGIHSIVIEKEDRVGGLARSFIYDDHTFDIGPHRFHTERKDVDTFIRETLGTKTLEIPRNSQVHFMDHYYPWPLRPKELLFHFPPRIALQVMWDLLTLYRKPDPASFRDQIENMYGRTLFKHFFEGYSSKFLGITPELTDADWASTGVDRAIIDKRLKMNSLWTLVWNTLLPGQIPDVQFVYPKGGCGVFTDRLAEHLVRMGGEVLTGAEVDHLEVADDTIEAVTVGDRRIEPSLVVWTGTLHSATRLLGLPEPNLRYLALVCYNLSLTEGETYDFQWCYHGDPEILFSRVSIPENFDAGNTPGGKRALCVEVACAEGDDIFQEPLKHLERVLMDLKHVDLLKTDSEVTAVHIERFPWAYPIYKLGYRRELEEHEARLAPFTNLVMAGRLGRFWYNNMDHCIEASLKLAGELTKQLRGARKER
ncbi:MAG: FAD-dependent oxidoreductase [Pseudomonadota bacterium]